INSQIPSDDYLVVFLVYHTDYNELPQFLPQMVTLKKPPGLIGRASQQDIFISKVILDSDAHCTGLQEGDQVLAVNDVDFQNAEHSKATEILKKRGLCTRALQPTALHVNLL
ncbi:hypothetical protein K5549_020522, partial [Capra hircus]